MGNILNPMCSEVPHRLSEETVRLAGRYLRGEFRGEHQWPLYELTELGMPADSPEVLLQAHAAKYIASRTPIIIRPEELLVGNAPFLARGGHTFPGFPSLCSISHTTVDFCDVLHKGLSGLEREIRTRQNENREEEVFAEALLVVIEAFRLWVKRCRQECLRVASETSEPVISERFSAIAERLERVPENPPQNFRDAVQAFWSYFEFLRLCGNWSGLGRFDWILGEYLDKDLAEHAITIDEARELIAHFWIKGTEWCYGLRNGNDQTPGSGDAQYYQNIVLGGIAPDGVNNVDNIVTNLVLDVVEELHISDYPIGVRINKNTSPALLRRIADVQLLGGGIVSIYNEDVVLEGLRRSGYPDADARNFTNDGCWEVILPGRTNFGYYPLDLLQIFQQALFTHATAESFEALFKAYSVAVRERIAQCDRELTASRDPSQVPDPVNLTTPLVSRDAVLSLFMPSCRRRGHSYSNNGADYVVRAIHGGGLPDVANSFLAIKHFVFEQKRITLAELVQCLENNWAGQELLRAEFANGMRYYGNDDDEADAMMTRVFDDFTHSVEQQSQHLSGNYKMLAGISTFGREIEWAPKRQATAFGRHAHEYLAPNLSPTPGTEKESLTSVINSYCSMKLTQAPNGCPLDLRLDASIRKLPDAAGVLASILRTFCDNGGFYLQLDTVDPEMLRQAQKEPDRFPNLVVRISGWSARFASLSKPWQDMIINRIALDTL